MPVLQPVRDIALRQKSWQGDDLDGRRSSDQRPGDIDRVLSSRIVVVWEDGDFSRAEVDRPIRIPLPGTASVAGRLAANGAQGLHILFTLRYQDCSALTHGGDQIGKPVRYALDISQFVDPSACFRGLALGEV